MLTSFLKALSYPATGTGYPANLDGDIRIIRRITQEERDRAYQDYRAAADEERREANAKQKAELDAANAKMKAVNDANAGYPNCPVRKESKNPLTTWKSTHPAWLAMAVS